MVAPRSPHAGAGLRCSCRCAAVNRGARSWGCGRCPTPLSSEGGARSGMGHGVYGIGCRAGGTIGFSHEGQWAGGHMGYRFRFSFLQQISDSQGPKGTNDSAAFGFLLPPSPYLTSPHLTSPHLHSESHSTQVRSAPLAHTLAHTHTHACPRAHTHTCPRTHTRMDAHTRACALMHTHSHIHTILHTRTCTHTHSLSLSHTHTHTHTHIYTHTCMCAHTHACTCTHTQTAEDLGLCGPPPASMACWTPARHGC